jgi:hypothetical protein
MRKLDEDSVGILFVVVPMSGLSLIITVETSLCCNIAIPQSHYARGSIGIAELSFIGIIKSSTRANRRESTNR